MEKNANINDSSDFRQDNSRTEVFLHLLMANSKRIYAFILTLVPNCSDADDIMQETTTLMWRKFDEFELGSDFVAWGIAIAHFRIMNHWRKYLKSPVCFSDRSIDAITKDAPAVLKGMDRSLEALQKCLSKLNQRERSMIRMRYEDDLASKVISQRVGISIHSFYKILSKIHGVLLRCVRRTLAEGAGL